MFRYTFYNERTQHVFSNDNDLQAIINFYHKVPRRKHSALIIIDNTTGEVIRYKQPRG